MSDILVKRDLRNKRFQTVKMVLDFFVLGDFSQLLVWREGERERKERKGERWGAERIK